MGRLLATLLLGPALLATAPRVARAPEDERPNLLVLITDDQRWDMLGKLKPELVTPEMDRLAAAGTHFLNAFVTTPICAASRASLLTGVHERTHRFTFITPPLDDHFVDASYPALLRAAGYRTGYVGKFGVGTHPGAVERMFDRFEPLGMPYWRDDGQGGKKHLSDLTGERAVAFLREAGDEPFCLTVGFNAPHADDGEPLQYFWPPSADELYVDHDPPRPPNSSGRFYDALPDYLRDGTMNRDRWQWRFNYEKKRKRMTVGYYRMISGIDRVIGRLRTALEETGHAEDTVIVLMGDNGYFLGERGYAGKWLPHEPSIRVPLVVTDPRIGTDEHGLESTALVTNLDLPATLLDLAGVPLPEGMQGASLVPFLRNKPPSAWREDIFVEHLMMHPRIRKHEGVRNSRYKYARYFESNPLLEELYDLVRDPLETTNLASDPEYNGLLGELRERTDELRDAYGGEFDASLWRGGDGSR